MINCEGIKAFHGTATIKPKNDKFTPFDMSGDWIYKSETGCWYCRGHSFMCSIVENIREEPDFSELISEIDKRINVIKSLVIGEENKGAIEEAIARTEDWINEVKGRMGASK